MNKIVGFLVMQSFLNLIKSVITEKYRQEHKM